MIVKEAGSKPNEKALFRGARALYSLGHYEEAQTYLDKLITAFSSNKDAKSLLAKTKLRLEEHKYGKYDWISLIGEARKPTPRAEVADYMGPIELSDAGLLVAKSDIKAGELLLYNKALDVLYPADLKGEKRTLIYDATRGVLGQGEGWKLTQKIADRISHDPALGDSVLSLLKGLKVYNEDISKDQEPIVDGQPIIDMCVALFCCLAHTLIDAP